MSMTTGVLVDRLRRHYIKRKDMPGGVFVEEVGLNGHTDRRCDAIYVGFTSASGQNLIGHEVKVTRADWLRELDQPEKSERWSTQCHAWYIVAPDAAVVPVEEVPDHWGLMYPDPKAKVRMQIVRRAQLYPERTPSWLVVRSIMARLDTLQRSAVEQGLRQAEHARRQSIETEVEKQVEQRTSRGPERHNTELVERLEEATGLDLRRGWDAAGYATPEQLAAALAIVRHTDTLTRFGSLANQARQARIIADRFDELQTLVDKARTVIGQDQPSLLDDDR